MRPGKSFWNGKWPLHGLLMEGVGINSDLESAATPCGRLGGIPCGPTRAPCTAIDYNGLPCSKSFLHEEKIGARDLAGFAHPAHEHLVVPSVFDPKRERSNFRISGPDNVCIALLPHLCRRYTTECYKVNFDFLPWQADAVDMLERGKLDLILHIDDGLLPSHFSSERFYREDWICAVARQSKFGDRLTLKQYQAAEHLIVTTLPNVQNIPDKQLAALGARRRSSVRMSYFGAALSCLPGTELVLTRTSGMRQNGGKELQFAARESAARVASISFLDGLAPEVHYRRAAHMAS